MRKKITSLMLAILGLSIIFVAVLLFLGLFKGQKAGILIESDPSSTVYVNGLNVGRTPYDAYSDPGEIIISIKPEDVEGVAFDDYETKVSLTPGIKTIIKRTFKETESLSSGVVVSFEKIFGKKSYVGVVSVPDNVEVKIDGKVYGFTPLNIEVPAGDHILDISTKGYFGKTLPIKVYSGYKLTVSAKLGESQVQIPLTDTPE